MCNDKDEKINEFVQEFHEHGLQCGSEISRLTKEMHPNAIAVIPLYRSCIVIEQSDDEKKEGIASIHAYADPHWLGGEIDIATLKSDDFHSKFFVQGRREGPGIYLENANKFQEAVEQNNADIEKDIERLVENTVDKRIDDVCQRLDNIIKFLKNSTIASSHDL